MNRRTLGLAFGSLALLALLVQLVPYRVHNPPVRQEPAWDSPQTRALAQRACMDCHSNQVQVPWYGHIAPVAWIVRRHVDEGRAALNLSEMDRPQEEAHEAAEALLEGEMPPNYYLALHPEARLTEAEKRQLADGLAATLGGEAEGHGAGGSDAEGRTAHAEVGERGWGDHDDDDDDD